MNVKPTLFLYPTTMTSPLGDAVKLPCGLVFPNRFVKSALAELMAGAEHKPTPTMLDVYNQWAQGGWGALITGNVQVDVNHLGTPSDPALQGEYTGKEKNEALVATWAKYAQACQQHGTPAIVQICHPGRQSFRGAGNRGLFVPAIAPSPIPVQIGNGLLGWIVSKIMFTVPREMMQADIDTVTRQFVDAALLMADSGFSGIELHGAHGYLIDQFLNPKTNLRTDAYGGTPEARAKFVVDIIAEIRKVVPSNFCVGIKLNSADHSSSTFEETMTQIGLLVEAGIDFLEVSGGSYEDPKMMSSTQTQKSARTAAREAFFIEFATEARKRYPNLVFMLTGGFRSRTGAEYAVKENACDLIGIGRPAAIDTKFPQLLLDESVPDETAQLLLNKVPAPFYTRFLPAKLIGPGLESAYYGGQLYRIAKGLKTMAPSV
ncbi:putative FMN binding oxidoreductase [Aspergillus coremiiformis]|uniref:Putative FMN binding oxidoreductase n=1 Tax=Aspergillus coremiiformis TaxID=138285 RepID=A0A5N6Z5U9_9EURO|nr:putative FMN binding oxidoreductase [Aspergillus coremiiformis]